MITFPFLFQFGYSQIIKCLHYFFQGSCSREAEMNALFQQVGRMKDDTGIIPCADRLHNLRQFGIIEAELSLVHPSVAVSCASAMVKPLSSDNIACCPGNMSFCRVCFCR